MNNKPTNQSVQDKGDIRLVGLTKQFGSSYAVEDINLMKG